jgi:hypothetical protein
MLEIQTRLARRTGFAPCQDGDPDIPFVAKAELAKLQSLLIKPVGRSGYAYRFFYLRPGFGRYRDDIGTGRSPGSRESRLSGRTIFTLFGLDFPHNLGFLARNASAFREVAGRARKLLREGRSAAMAGNFGFLGEPEAVLFIAFSATLILPCCFSPDRSLSSGSRVAGVPMPKAIEQEMSVLSSSKDGLVYLTANDWALLADKACRVSFRKGQVLVHKGKQTNGVFLLLKGKARVQIPSQAGSPLIGPGEICGEMSFLDGVPASASVVAHEDVEAYQLDRPTLEKLFELFPHLASRFYRSLATNLSRRLRDLIEPKLGKNPGQ